MNINGCRPILHIFLPFVIAFFFAAVFTLQAWIPHFYSGDTANFSWTFVGLPLLLRYLLWALLYLLMRRFFHQLFQNLLPGMPVISVKNTLFFGFILFTSLLHSALIYVIYIGYSWLFKDLALSEGLLEHVIRTVYAGTISSGIELLLLLGWLLGSDYFKRSQQEKLALVEMQQQLSEARLVALQMKLNPHFLFNAFNSVVSLIDTEKEKAKDMLVEVSGIMRDLLKSDHRTVVTLGQEIDFSRRYLAIESVRFGDRLQVNIDVEPSFYSALVPNLLLQPILENCFKHGFRQKSGVCQIDISASRHPHEESITLVISDNGGNNSKHMPESGIGLSNTRSRLEQLFGDEATVNMRTLAQGTTVTIQLPLQMAPD